MRSSRRTRPRPSRRQPAPVLGKASSGQSAPELWRCRGRSHRPDVPRGRRPRPPRPAQGACAHRLPRSSPGQSTALPKLALRAPPAWSGRMRRHVIEAPPALPRQTWPVDQRGLASEACGDGGRSRSPPRADRELPGCLGAVPRRLRPHLRAVYGFAGSSTCSGRSRGDRLAALDELEQELAACYTGEPSWPVTAGRLRRPSTSSRFRASRSCD